METNIKQALSVMTDRNAELWGIVQISSPFYRAEQNRINQLVNQRLDNIKLCYNKLYVFKPPAPIDGLEQEDFYDNGVI